MASPTLSLVSLPALGVFALAAIFLNLLITFFTCRLKSVPGPWYSTFTHYVLKYHIVTRRRMYYVHALHQKYGPVVRIAPNEIDVSDPQAVQAIHKIGSGYIKAAWYDLFAPPAPKGCGEPGQRFVGLFASRDTKRHAAMRRLFARTFSTSSLLTNWDEVIRAKVTLAVRRIRAEAEAGAGPGAGADVLKWWTLMAIDIVTHLCFGESFHSLELGKQTPLIDALQRAGLAGILTLEFPLVGWLGRRLPIPAVQEIFHADDVVDEYGVIAYQNLRSGDVNLKNLFGLALASADNAKELEKPEQQTFIEQTVRYESTNLLFAGSDTTAATLTYLVWAVLKQPTLRDALEEEIAGLSETLSQDELLNRAPLLNSVIEETLRLYAAAPSALPREVPAGGATMCGHFIPGGTTASAQAYTLHRDPNAFSDPLTFDGWRFLKQSTTPAQKAALLPFGLGSRVCLGINLAMLELRFATALFFRECRGAKLCPETTDVSMEMMDVFLISPKAHQCKIMIEKPREVTQV